ncbi:MAG: F0F1 ATP synthase subunit B [Candidatus Omnitrophota bacterium]
MELFKLLNLQLITAQIVCFFLVLFLLKKFLWKPVFEILEARRKKVDDEIAAIDALKAEAVSFRSEMEKSLAVIEETAQKRLKEVESLGEEKSREIREKARLEANKIIEDAKSELHFELLRTREALRGDVVDMVMKVTEQMIQEKLTFAEDRKIVESLLADLEKANEK